MVFVSIVQMDAKKSFNNNSKHFLFIYFFVANWPSLLYNSTHSALCPNEGYAINAACFVLCFHFSQALEELPQCIQIQLITIRASFQSTVKHTVNGFSLGINVQLQPMGET